MSESKYLKWQDKNGDGLIDVCEDVISVKEVPKCPICKSNPNYLAPNWRNRTIDEPWINEKYVRYQVTVNTKIDNILPTAAPAPSTAPTGNAASDPASPSAQQGTSTTPPGTPPMIPTVPPADGSESPETQHMRQLFIDHQEEAIESLLSNFDKLDTEETRQIIRDVIIFQKYDLGPRAGTRLKLLYGVPCVDFYPLPPAEEEDEDEEDEETGDIIVKYKASFIAAKLIKFRKAMNLYSRYYKVYQKIDGGVLVEDKSGAIFTAAQFSKYGDNGIFGKGVMFNVLKSLDDFFNNRDLNIYGFGSPTIFKDRIEKIKFTFDSEYDLKKMKVWTVACGEIPIFFGKKKLAPLKRRPAWRDKRAVAYFAQLTDMETDLTAREEMPWIEFVEKYTYPKVLGTVDYDPQSGATAASCVADALAKEAKQFGEDILDEVFSIGDAVAYAFHKNVCKKSLEEVEEEKVKIGLVWDPETKTHKNLRAMAKEQAFKKMKDDEDIFTELCARFMGMGVTSSSAMLDDLWAHGFDRLKICGLFDLLIDAIKCLMGGLSLEEALGKIIKSALSGMNIGNFGDLFFGLPPEKQQELEELVKKKLESGDVFKDGSSGQQLSDTIDGKIRWERPFPNEKNEDEQKDTKKEGPTEGMTSSELQESSERSRRTLAQQFDAGGEEAAKGLSPNKVLEAYVLAMIEVYSDNLLFLLDRLNKYPGAQMIAKTIALIDCPRPPIFNPNFLDFIKSIDIPFCNNGLDITIPRFDNPFGWIPDLKDLAKLLFEALKLAIQKAIMSILFKLMIKVCELIGDAICKALETVGDIAKSLPDLLQGNTTISDVIRESICGPNATDQQVNDTIADMFAKLGIGGAALSDQAKVLDFASDISAASTRNEVMRAFNGEMPDEMGRVINNLIEYEYPEFRDALPNPASIGDFFGDMGNLLPAEVKNAMDDFLDTLPDDDFAPANPSLCATPEDLENFENLRCNLLEGRASSEQCRAMFDALQDDMLEDLGDLSDIMQTGIPRSLENAIPPLIATPDCEDGLIPFESEEAQEAAATALGAGLQQLKLSFTKDMLGNGPGEKNWGMLNMILSDTMGNPLTAHWRKSANQNRYVSFVTDDSEEDPGDNDGEDFLFMFKSPAATKLQRGNFPYKVAEWMQTSMAEMDITFESNNEFKTDKTVVRTYDELGVRPQNLKYIDLPDFGYNTKFAVHGEEALKIIRKGRKKTADIKLAFKDNNRGEREHEDQPWVYGFNVGMYLSDMRSTKPVGGIGEIISNMGSPEKPLDVTRINITELLNFNGVEKSDLRKSMTRKEWKEYKKKLKDKPESVAKDRLFEFISIDDTLSGIDPTMYPSFAQCFATQKTHIPQIYMLEDLLKNTDGSAPGIGTLKTFYNTFMGEMTKKFRDEVVGNEPAFQYGAKYDGLTESDADYVVKAGQTDSPGGTLYSDATIDGDSITNDDAILGVSRNQLEKGNDDARIFYLDPITYGGSYINPAVYIKPLKNKGWLGMANVVFPEFTPCKPSKTDLIDFGEIESEVAQAYNSIPEDKRLKQDPSCAVEVPYNRILERPAKAGMQGLIKAACRVYASVHFVKSMATFTKFYPSFPDNFSSIYAQYIIEDMEASFKEAQGAGWEFFNPFKDTEFWYAFLEQAVQTYGRLVDDGQRPGQSGRVKKMQKKQAATATENADPVLDALFRINDMQEAYEYPFRDDLRRAKDIGEVRAIKTLKNYRSDLNLEAVKATEESAKLILKEFMIAELNAMGEKFVKNLDTIGLQPTYTDLGYYLLTHLSQGGIDLDLDKEISEEVTDMPGVGENFYTSGGELSTSDGEVYIGYYHGVEEDDGNVAYFTGEFASESADQKELTVFANKVTVPIGDIESLGASFGSDSSRPFTIEKYISIEGTKYPPNEAIDIIKTNTSTLNISDVYPGTIAPVYKLAQSNIGSAAVASGQQEPEYTDEIVGIQGELGVRYGLRFSLMISGTSYIISTVEVDALDTTIAQIAPLSGDSKLLLCLINNLKEEESFRLLTSYVFPLNKILAFLAIYNDLAFLPSIGEKTVPDGSTLPEWPFKLSGGPSFDDKPGVKVKFPNASEGDFTPNYDSSKDGWASKGDRDPGLLGAINFVREWDNWDKVLLRNSNSRIKKLFKAYYNARDFDPTAGAGKDFDPVKIIMGNMKAAMVPNPGAAILPWWRARRRVSNPFDANGNLCEKSD
tara:strand:- start:5092 stop:11673 length:6582 start_codon:yes stop_codon:yes gene_type:complete